MNYRRGLKRAFLVLGALYYLTIAAWGFMAWTDTASAHESNLSACIDSARHGTASDGVTEDDCRRIWPAPSWRGTTAGGWIVVAAILMLPAILHACWKLLAWVGRGFRADAPA
jgi:hypothetical protein